MDVAARRQPGAARPARVAVHPGFRCLLALSIPIAALLGACTRPASKAPTADGSAGAPEIRVTQVRVTQGSGIYITGRSTLPGGECLQTELLAHGEPVDWWPGVCIQADANQWEMLVALGQNGAPERLAANDAYEIHAWWPKQPVETATHFPFDLDGPQPAQ